jgi:hypothetical protein
MLYGSKEVLFVKVFSASIPAFAVLKLLTDAEPLPEALERVTLVLA